MTITKELLRHTKGLRILYVEPSQSVRETTQDILQKYFDHIDTAVDGEHALSLYKKLYSEEMRFYDIVFTCIEMPNMDGITLCKAILEFDSHQKIIILSITTDPASLIELINLKITKFIPKPIQPELLDNAITTIAQEIYSKKLKEDELNEILNHNLLLKRREDLNQVKLQASLKTLSEFNDVLNESGIVSKTTPDGNIIYVNDQFCTVSGYTRQELIGQRHNILKSGDIIPSFFEKLWNTITNQKSYRGIFKNRSKDGNIYYIEQLIKPIVNVDGEITEFIAVATDITQIMHSMQSAKQSEQAKDDFFRNISHEMRTPLNSILTMTSILKERLIEDSEAIEMLTVTERNSQNLANLVESILDLQRLQHNDLELQINEFETSTLYTSLITHYEVKATAKGIVFEHSLDSDVPSILIGDAKRLQQIFTIVLDNAIKFTPKSGKVDFMLTYAPKNSLLICQVQDSGIGMSAQDQGKIFKLTQIDSSLSRQHEGSGLGLTIAHALMQKMDGIFTVYSTLNKGSTFMMEIPIKQP